MKAYGMRANRWGDNDRYWGPFTYSSNSSYRPLALVIQSDVHEDHDDGTSSIRISAGGRTLIWVLPWQMIKPQITRHYPGDAWDAETVARLRRDYYETATSREFGFSYSDGFLQVFRGPHTMDSSTDRSWACHLPWTQWRHVRRSLYDLNGRHFWSDLDSESKGVNRLGSKGFSERFEIMRGWESLCPKDVFRFEDFDGEALTATTHIEEREWLFGTGWFKWLSLFRRPKIIRSLCIEFSSETGRRKGSWKGGTLGHSIEMLPGELHEAAFRRYCQENNMKFVA